MTSPSLRRKLTAILSADAKGYSRLMGQDEEATVQTITAYRQVMAELIHRHQGRVVDSPGDNLLADFASVVDATRCAVEIQGELKNRNAQLPAERRMEFRIGINLGDVIVEGERIYGDGVNIAARLEGLADSGGICISQTAYDQVKNKIQVACEYLGEQTVKNIVDPVRVYRVVMEPASMEQMILPLPEKPSIAVLPFDNLSGDATQEYLADGISESIITTLSKTPRLLVIARNSTFTYKGKPVKAQQVSQELGVRYILEGSVLKAGERVRITAQLIDAMTGHHRWSERYDRDLKDLFLLLDEISQQIAVALQVELTHGEQARLWHKTTSNFEAWSCVVKANSLFERFTREDNLKARALLERALELDPGYAFAWTMLAFTHSIEVRFGFSHSPAESLGRAIEIGRKALELDDALPEIHSFWNTVYMLQGQSEKAIAEGEKAINLGPNNTLGHMLLAQTLFFAGRFDEAIVLGEKALRLSPYCPSWFLNFLAQFYHMARRYEQALATYKRILDLSREGEYNPIWIHLGLAEVYTELGQTREAGFQVAEVLRMQPDFSLEFVRHTSFFEDPAHLERRLAALRQAGLK